MDQQGRPPRREPPGGPAVLRQTGSMGKTAFYPFLSGRDNLRAVARRCGLGDHRVDVVLGQAGLANGPGTP
jgi:ABC-type multidrug transport system ATPase subunit